MNVLIAPGHYVLDRESGNTEYAWAYHIVDALSAHPNLKLFVITGSIIGHDALRPNVVVVSIDRQQKSNLSSWYRLSFVARYYAAARTILRQQHIDLIHHILPFGYGNTFNLLPLLGYTRNTPFVVGPLQSPHTAFMSEERPYAQGDMRLYRGIAHRMQERIDTTLLNRGRFILNAMSTGTLRRSDALVAVNEQARTLYAESAPHVPAVVIPPGVATDHFDPIEVIPRSDSVIELLHVGWLIQRKGVDILINAVAMLLPRFPSLYLRIIGDGPQRQDLAALVDRLGIGDHVRFEGRVAHGYVAQYYARASIFVSMSYSESFGQSVIEAMLCGLAVISADNVGSREIITQGKDGYLVQAGNIQQLVERLAFLITNPSVRVQIGKRARQAVSHKYNWQTVGDQYLAVYHDVLRRRGGRSHEPGS